MCVRFRGVWPMPPCEPCGRRRRVDCVAGGAAWTVWPMAPRVLLGLSVALVARCVWLGLVALSIASCDRLGLAALLNVLRSRLDLPATIAPRGRLGLAALLNVHRSIGWALVV